MIIDSSGDVVDKFRRTVSFDDVLLVPQYSDIESRNEVDLECELGQWGFNLPVISSPMDTVTEVDMAQAMLSAGGLGIIHRYNSIDEQQRMVEKLDEKAWIRAAEHPIACAIGATGDYLERAHAAVASGARILCVDVAHGHHILMKNALTQLKKAVGDVVHLMAGNVATREGFDDLARWGADSIRVGIGGGSICSTRLVSGHGIPTLQSVLDCAQSEFGGVPIIADGGIRTTGDMVKALAAGADFVMVGSMLAGTDASPGDTFIGQDKKKYKVYRGMASRDAQTDWRGKSSTPEGISTTIRYKGSVVETLQNIRGGICSGLSYSGARRISDFRCRSRFVEQTAAGGRESYTHILVK
jgi:IMP dehydrogenase